MRTNKEKRKIKEHDDKADWDSLASWRLRYFSITHLAAYVPFLFIISWTALLIYDYVKKSAA